MNPAIAIKGLAVTLNGFKALNNVDLELPEGRIIGFIGPSGAGKTTLIRSIVGGLSVPGDKVTVLGMPAGSKKLRGSVSYMSQELSVYPDLTVKENLEYFITMVEGRRHNDRVTEILDTVDLKDKAGQLVKNLSGGQRQRMSLAVALVGSPRVMVLDEPTVGLDPVLRERLWKLFRRLSNEGITLIVSSHVMDEASRCDNLVLIRNGSVIAHSSPEELLKRTNVKTVEQAFLKLVGDKE